MSLQFKIEKYGLAIFAVNKYRYLCKASRASLELIE